MARKQYSSTITLLFVVAFFCNVFLSTSSEAKMKLENGMYILDDVQGEAPMNNRKKSVVREEAKRFAYGTLAEKVLCDIMPNIKEKENYSAVFDKVSSKIPTLIKNFKINSEKISEDGTMHISATCKISEKALDDLIGSDIIAMLGNPRIMILIDEKVGGKAPFISTTEGEVSRIFEKAGYLIVDPDQARVLLNMNPSTAFDDPTKLSEAARTLRADIIIVGKATAGAFAKQKLYGVTLYGVSGTVQLKAILTQTAYQITSKTFSSATGRKPVGSVGAGADRCFRSATAQAASQILYKIAYSMASAGSALNGITVNIKIADASFTDVENVEKHLRDLIGKSGEIFERSYKDNILEIDVVSGKTARDVASFLSGHSVNVKALTAQTIDAVVQHAGRQQELVSSGSALNISIADVSSFKRAGEIEDMITQFIKSSNGKVVAQYNDKKLELVINLADSTDNTKIARNIASFLEENGIEIASVSSSLVSGKAVTEEKRRGLW